MTRFGRLDTWAHVAGVTEHTRFTRLAAFHLHKFQRKGPGHSGGLDEPVEGADRRRGAVSNLRR